MNELADSVITDWKCNENPLKIYFKVEIVSNFRDFHSSIFIFKFERKYLGISPKRIVSVWNIIHTEQQFHKFRFSLQNYQPFVIITVCWCSNDWGVCNLIFVSKINLVLLESKALGFFSINDKFFNVLNKKN